MVGLSTALIRVGGTLLGVHAAAWAVFIATAVVHRARTRRPLHVWGISTFSPTVFRQWGWQLPNLVLLLSFLGLCVVGTLTGLLCWDAQHMALGAVLSLIVIIPTGIFWVGYALPVPPWIAAPSAATLIAGLMLRGC